MTAADPGDVAAYIDTITRRIPLTTTTELQLTRRITESSPGELRDEIDRLRIVTNALVRVLIEDGGTDMHGRLVAALAHAGEVRAADRADLMPNMDFRSPEQREQAAR